MSSIQQGSPPAKPDVDPAGQREFMITALRATSARSRLTTNLFYTIGVSLRHRMVTGDRPVITQLSARRIGYRVDHIRAWLDGKRRSVAQ